MLNLTFYSFCLTIVVAQAHWNPAKEFENEPLERDEVIDAVNNARTTWKAGRNFPPELKKSYVKHLLGAKKPSRSLLRKIQNRQNKYAVEMDIEDLPKEFDARQKWPKCKALQEARDQGECGSCWAVSTAAAFTDRLCIATDGKFNGYLSAQEVVTCVYRNRPGCRGGNPMAAWDYMESHGIVTGGDYDSQEGCKPYGFPSCNHYVDGRYNNNCSKDYYNPPPTPHCTKSCSNKRYKDNDYINDKHKADYSFMIRYDYKTKGMKAIDTMKKEIFKHGPIVASFDVFEDFFSYKSGVYQQTNDTPIYGHAVKVIGWGEEEGVPYWLVSNSWNSDWGDNGFFKIIRGTNECGFEDGVSVGYA